ncbi:bacteriocin [Rhizobium sp. VS19-DR104.2]|uniref:bacteriocin n=1 Tax=unclassified Rhizobium TaxID=2613769 RepID=UPI001C5AE0C3|nr:MULTISPECIES: bacteriocin [unclassified Rhizobium]MBZ5763066.1 bacteriocin [Rhizobium sp. VS19-DR96]MBZ5768942.1 bacteriocin [Rhizobium sp. VS19-DR129.2]MBZ5776560.1 bacteriocin [Rhizobium sp. VS19-DRK62.2]MBZ5787701.1 bacteriocin [Rhizobium sp. VS19-DR121]MBZ5805074.1 bacteriocin [Rhizobium sp. VS19-DR181]
MEHSMVSREDAHSNLRELTDQELDNVSGGWELSGFGYSIGKTDVAGGSWSYIYKGQSLVYSELCMR